MDRVVGVLSEAALRSKARPEYSVAFTPTVARPQWIKEHPIIDRRTLPEPIKSTHCIMFRRNDKRQKDVLGKDRLTITGIDCYGKGLAGMQCPKDPCHDDDVDDADEC